MTRALIGVVIAANLVGCATTNMIPFKVDSVPPGAQVDVNGITLGNTPVEIELQCSKRWVGVAVAPGGWSYDNAIYTVTVYPAGTLHGLSQTKRINACQVKNPPGHLSFDLELETVTPLQRMDLNINPNTSKQSSSVEENLRILKKLRDQGILTEDEYREKVDKALDDTPP